MSTSAIYRFCRGSRGRRSCRELFSWSEDRFLCFSSSISFFQRDRLGLMFAILDSATVQRSSAVAPFP
jgi:hypothetical protein